MAESQLYDQLEELTLTSAELRQFNYPYPCQNTPGKALVVTRGSYYTVFPGRYRRKCKRCLRIYSINTNGDLAKREECTFHPGNKKNGRFSCCKRGTNDKPCQRVAQHVHNNIDPGNLHGFVRPMSHKLNPGIYALDCEMVFSKAGMELAAISIVDADCKLVYETAVQPEHPIVDFNTEYSNLTMRDLKGVTTRLRDVQEKLLSLVGRRTILVGHSLNNDLLRLKFMHDVVVDTSVLYPNPNGAQFRTSLKVLQEKHFPKDTSPSYFKCDAELSMKLALLKCS